MRVVDPPGEERVEVASGDVVEPREQLGRELLGPEQLPQPLVVDVPWTSYGVTTNSSGSGTRVPVTLRGT